MRWRNKQKPDKYGLWEINRENEDIYCRSLFQNKGYPPLHFFLYQGRDVPPINTKHFVCALIPTLHLPLILFLLPLDSPLGLSFGQINLLRSL